MNKLLYSTLLIILLVSCKTQEQIERESMIDSMSIQVRQSQKLSADKFARLSELEQKVNELNGMLQEQAHYSKLESTTSLTSLNSKMDRIEEALRTYKKQVEQNTKALKAQKKYLDKVLKGLSNIAPKSKVSKSKKKRSVTYNNAMKLYKQGKYIPAEDMFLVLLKNKKIKGNQRARLLHNMGMIEFMHKKYDSALTYFSKLFTDYPKAPYNPNGLLYLGKSFKALKKHEQAKQTFEELINRYPKSSSATKAKKLISK